MAVKSKRRSGRTVSTHVSKARAARRPKRPMSGDLFVNPNASTVTGKVDKTVNQQIDALPFVRTPRKGKKGARCFWSARIRDEEANGPAAAAAQRMGRAPNHIPSSPQ
jgi:hypothetical protein